MNTIKTFNKSALAAALILGCLHTAQAEGPYIGLSLGTPDYKSSVNGISGNGSGLGGKLYGGYQFNPIFAVEAGYFDLGHIDNGSGRVKTRGAFIDGVGIFEFAPKWSALARIGFAQGRFRTTNGDDSSPALRLGAGIEYALDKAISLRGEYAHYRFSSAFGTKANIGEFTAGVKFGF